MIICYISPPVFS